MMCWGIGLALCLPALGDEFTGFTLRPDEGFVDQMLYSDMACGPAAVLNVLKFGGPKYREAYSNLQGASDRHRLHGLLDRYFRRPSEVLDQGHRFTEHAGVLHEDLAVAARELSSDHGLPEPYGTELLRGLDEPSEDFLARVHQQLSFSLFQGMPPVIALRSQYADQDSRSGKWRWKTLRDHFVVVVRVPSALRKGEMGFAFDYIDPDGGRLATGFVFAERRQNFAGFQGNSHAGGWLPGNRFLLITAPTAYSMIPEDKADWHARTLTTLSYYVGL